MGVIVGVAARAILSDPLCPGGPLCAVRVAGHSYGHDARRGDLRSSGAPAGRRVGQPGECRGRWCLDAGRFVLVAARQLQLDGHAVARGYPHWPRPAKHGAARCAGPVRCAILAMWLRERRRLGQASAGGHARAVRGVKPSTVGWWSWRRPCTDEVTRASPQRRPARSRLEFGRLSGHLRLRRHFLSGAPGRHRCISATSGHE
mmetsp:Transcript_67963/g.196895  ORF Transcript_67963/g.196895 Transcript_67963/m.196895 type:complete len:203 (-) Transcript_67963:9-617(-)